ncbi:MAG: nucleoside hydrolase [Bacilli bacterium]|nr:nucleoside hydrolase [Bacilli bacterium]
MRIGLDIDNVITDFDKSILEEFIEEDKNKRNIGIINPYARHITSGMFDWSKEEIKDFYINNMERIAKTLPVRDGAKYYMDKLLEDGHEIYLISHRVYPDYNNPFAVTVEWLKENNINYTKLILSKSTDKSPECIENKIDIMFDDVVSNCLKLRDNGVNVCLMGTEYNQIYKKDLPMVKEWSELYEKVNEMNKIKNVILDTDMYNEVDDQFALTYLMKSLDKLNIEAITIAPFSGSGYANTKTIEEGTEKSYEVTLKVLDMMNMSEYKDKVYKGAINYFNDSKEDNDAVNKIVEIVKKNDKTTLIAIGAITNIALAINKDSSIIDKMEVVWLGGNSFLSKQNQEFNFRQDMDAVRTVFESKVKLTVIPCRNVASNLVTTSYELEHYLNNSEVGKYLCSIFKDIKKHYYKDETDEYGSSKTLWDLSAVAYVLNKDWFVCENISCPNILSNGCYEMTNDKHKITFVNDLFRNKIFRDYFIKMEDINEIN